MKKNDLKSLIKECITELLDATVKLNDTNKVKEINLGTNFMWSDTWNSAYEHCQSIHKNNIKLNQPFGANRGMSDYSCECSCPNVSWNIKDNPYRKSIIKWTIDSTD